MNLNTGMKVEVEAVFEALPPEGQTKEGLKRVLLEKGYKIESETREGWIVMRSKSTALVMKGDQ